MSTMLNKIRATITGDDAERLDQRDTLKRQVADIESKLSRRTAIHKQLAMLAAREEAAVSAHEKTCQPIQATLAALEERIADAINGDAPIGDEIALEQAETLGKLELANAKLRAEVEGIKKARLGWQKELAAFGALDTTLGQLRSKLTSRALANPSLLLHRFVLDQESHWADKRRVAAERGFESATAALRAQEREREARIVTNSRGEVVVNPAPNEHELSLRRAVDEWIAERDEAERAMADVQRRRRATTEAIVNE